jgi:tRNA threonylcarbamoyl adenosine modification protein (Sua5/YciO/YrdC/YwlC family)
MSIDSEFPLTMSIDDPALLGVVGEVLDRGECIVIPTDTVYGIAARGDSREGILRMQQVKGRSDAFPPPILVADTESAWGLARRACDQVHLIGEHFWPGALTLILPTHRYDLSLADRVGTLGLRVPDHPQLRNLLRTTGPLAVSSANWHDLPPATSVEEAIDQFGTNVSLYVDGGPAPGLTASTVVDCTGEITVLRVGLITREEIYALCGDEYA